MKHTHKDRCDKCARVGADLKAPCPGVKTAAEYVDWSRQRKQPRKGKK